MPAWLLLVVAAAAAPFETRSAKPPAAGMDERRHPVKRDSTGAVKELDPTAGWMNSDPSAEQKSTQAISKEMNISCS